MHGPYSARIHVGGETISVYPDDLREGQPVAERFYEDAHPALVVGATRCAVFYAAALLDVDQKAEVEIVGYTGSGKSERETVYHVETVRRDERGRLLSTLGSRFNERVFRGV